MVKSAVDRIDSLPEGEAALLSVDELALGKKAVNHVGHYNVPTTIMLGFNGDKLVDQEFYIHEEAAKIIFPDFRIPDPATREALGFKTVPKAGTIVIEKRDGEKPKREARGRKGRAFAGKRIVIPVPKSIQPTLKKYFGKGNRRTLSLIFPPLASNMCIAVWIATHCETNKVDEFTHFYSASGIKNMILPRYNTADPTELKKLLGSWGTKMRARLDGAPIASN